jgi:hypothetical protein
LFPAGNRILLVQTIAGHCTDRAILAHALYVRL